MRISIPEDSGNIEIVNIEHAQDIRLKIRPDSHAPNYQWFNFILEGEPGEPFVLTLENAGDASYPGWSDGGVEYRATASSDGDTWSRLSTTFDKTLGTSTIRGELVGDRMQIAFFPPYPYAKHLELIEKARVIPNTAVTSLGKSVEGRDITLVTVGTPDCNKKNIWMIARQHPGETMAEWFAEGLIERLSSGEDLSAFFDHAVLYMVPNMNPDGSYHGNLRTNAAGKDLNRQWDIYDNEATAPEVFYVRQAMLKEGVAAFFDVHGDETNPYVFPDGRGVGCTENSAMMAIESEFLDAYIAICPYLQKESKYAPDLPGQANKNMAKAFFAERLNCLSLIFEMPNKELVTGEDWTDRDCKQFGARLIDPLIQLMPKLVNQKWMSTVQIQAPRGLSFLEEARKAVVVSEVPVIEGAVPHGCCLIS